MKYGRNANAMEEACPVCFGEVSGDNSLVCPNRHRVCTDCLRRLVEPCGVEFPATGFCYRCPMCRELTALSRMHVLILICGSWERAEDRFFKSSSFRSEYDMQQWNAGT